MYCVVVGDIVGSRELSPEVRSRVTHAAKDAFDRINTKYMGSLMTTFGMVRGDAFEGVMLTQHYAPQIVQDIIKAIYGVDKTKVRISVVLGQLTITGSDRNETDGPAFHKANDDIAKLKKSKSDHWFQVSFDVGSLGQPLADSVLSLLTALTEGWTEKQREIVWAMEAHEGYQKIVAKLLNLTPSVISKQLKAAHYDVYRQAWDSLTEYLIAMDDAVVTDKPVIRESYVPYFNMGIRRLSQRNFPEAIRLLENSVELAKNDLEDNDPQYIPLYNRLAEAYIQNNQYNKAEIFIKKSLDLQKNMSKYRLDYVDTLSEQASYYSEKKQARDLIEAKKIYLEAIDISCVILDKDHPQTSELYNDLAIVYERLGDYKNAIELHKKAINGSEKRFKEAPINYAVSISNLATIYWRARRHKEALPYAELARQLYEEYLPPKHEYITEAKQLLADLEPYRGGEET